MKLNRNTKKAQAFVKSFYNSEIDTLYGCYSRVSHDKMLAFSWCKDKCAYMGGWRFRIISHNIQSFTCGWLYEDKETGVVMLNVETHCNTYEIEY